MYRMARVPNGFLSRKKLMLCTLLSACRFCIVPMTCSSLSKGMKQSIVFFTISVSVYCYDGV